MRSIRLWSSSINRIRGLVVGGELTARVGSKLGDIVGLMLEALAGARLGDIVGLMLEARFGAKLEARFGAKLEALVGLELEALVGARLGALVGFMLGGVVGFELWGMSLVLRVDSRRASEAGGSVKAPAAPVARMQHTMTPGRPPRAMGTEHYR